MPESINSLSPDFRDFLLNRNLVTDSISDNGLTSLLVGIGTPKTDISSVPDVVNPSESIVSDGVLHKDLNVLTNKYQGTDYDYKQVNIVYQSNLPPTSAIIYSSNYTDDNGILDETLELPPNRGFSQGGDIRQYNTSLNLYNDTDKQIVTNLVYQPNPNVQYTNYIDVNSAIVNPAIDILGSVFDGNGVGLGAGKGINAIQPNFDLRSTIIGRVLGASGVIGDTPIGQAGAKYLALSLANNAAFGLQQETIGHLNLNPLNLAMNGLDSFVVPNYNITVPQGKLGKVLDFGARVLGFEVPVSIFDNTSSIFNKENPVSNILRANAQISNSGKGQVLTLFANIKQNKYRPGFQDDRVKGENQSDEEKVRKGSALNSNIYAFEAGDGGIEDLINTNDSGFETEHGKITSELKGGFNDQFGDLENTHRLDNVKNGFSWSDDFNNSEAQDDERGVNGYDDVFKDNPEGILAKTKSLFATNKMMTLVSGHGVLGQTNSEIQNTTRDYVSKGSAVLSNAALKSETGTAMPPDATFCRTWTTFDRYSQVQDLQKHSGVDGTTAYREGLDESVLGDNGFVKIAPTSNGKDFAGGNIKNYMFSLENLAWADDHAKLLPCETGPGDQFGKKGRIMWFPPYDLSVSENNSVNWDSTNFIGRGEPIYTYSNTERTGTLQFKIVVDHPSYLNAIKGESDEYIASFFAGCTDIDPVLAEKLTVIEKNEILTRNQLTDQQKDAMDINPDIPFVDFYFPNDVAELNDTYENASGSTGLGQIQASGNYVGSARNYKDDTDFGLNGDQAPGATGPLGGWISAAGQDALKKVLNEQCQACKVRIYGYASVAGGKNNEGNQKLSDARAEAVKVWFKTNIFDSSSPIYDIISMDERFEESKGKGVDEGGSEKCTITEGVDTSAYYGCKIHRKVNVNILHDKILEAKLNKNEGDDKEVEDTFNVSNKITNRFYNECNYFEVLAQEDKFVYDTLKEKLKYFHPAFHAITPEGLNSRLTFLLQCTRQGPTNIKGAPDNLAFGRPPVCILRLGDFYHSKIVIDNVGITYEPLVWDLNPEGIGVQPMIATVDLSFKMIGGQSLRAPINKLQNAVSFNFFGNTQVYDVRADKLKENKGEFDLVLGAEKLESISDPVEVSKKPNGTHRNEAVTNQENLADNVNSNTEESTESTETTEIKILGSNGFDLSRPSLTDNRLKINVKAKQQGIYSASTDGTITQLITDDEYNLWLEKTLTIKLDSAEGDPNPIHIENIITATKGSSGTDAESLFGLGYAFGDECVGGGYCVEGIEPGKQYKISIWYKGNKKTIDWITAP